MRLISFLAPVENHGGQETLALVIILYRVIKLGSSKGKYPAMSTNKIMPQDHTSAAIPS
jgi:hypothetical protein